MEKRNVPKLRFKGFEDEWELQKLSDVFKLSSGGTPNRNNLEFWNGDIPWITTGEVDFNIIKDSKEKITKSAIEKSSAKIFPRGTILIAMYGQGKTRGKSAILGIEASTNQACAALLSKKKINNFFTYQYISGEYENIRLMCNSGGQKNLSLAILKEFKFGMPSLEEQNKISNFLSNVDNIIEEQEGKVKDLEQYKKGMMQKIFKQEVRFRDENGGEYTEWEEKKLGDITDIGTGSNDLQDKTENGKYPFFVRSANIEKIDKYTFDGEAILIPGDGNIGQIYHYINGKFAYHQRVYKISDFNTNVLGKYIYFYMNKFFKKEALKNSVKATVDSLRLPTLTNMIIQLPCLEEQTKIVNFLSNIDKIIEEENKKLEDLRLWKKGLLQQMFV